MQPQVEIRELTTDEELQKATSLMRELRGDRISDARFVEDVRTQQQQGYQLFGAFSEGMLVALAGVRRQRTMSRGWHLFVDDLVTSEARQAQGFGKRMMGHLEDLARREDLPAVYLDSRATAKTFYEGLGFRFLTSLPCFKDL